ncbi:4Fe-4S dicluster domain-containing protein [Chloroflexota bacterium]
MELSRKDFLKASAGAVGVLLLKPPALALAKESQTREGMAMLVDVTKCVSCWWCYAACKNHNKLPETIKPDPEQPPPLSPDVWTTLKPIKIGNEWHSRKQACNHCSDAACVEVCPTGALSYNRLGFVQYDKEKCSGCGYCAEFCPFGIPQMESGKLTSSAVMDKCTFCVDRVTNGEQPACAEACPTGAIKFGKRAELVQEGQERVDTLRKANANAVFYGDKELGGLHVMYVLDDIPEVYGLPTDPSVPAAAIVRDVLKWVGVGAAIAVVAGFGINYIIAREAKITSELPGDEYMRKRKDEKEK